MILPQDKLIAQQRLPKRVRQKAQGNISGSDWYAYVHFMWDVHGQ